jgi:hypothetical protein
MWRAYSDALSLHRFNTRSRMAYTVYLVPSRAFGFLLGASLAVSGSVGL